MKNRLLPTLALAALASLAGPLSSADAATRPAVSSVSPLSAKVGGKLTIRGTGFLRGANRNTVIFMSNRGPTVFVKAPSATSTSLVVPLPAKLEAGMAKAADGSLRPNRFQLRVVARDPARWFTPLNRSPLIAPRSSAPPAPLDTDKDGQPNSTDPDDDNDFLPDTVEREVRTDPLRKDTDGDGREDGWEYYSAKDLNSSAVPYPAKRPFPNALDPSDGGDDFDGDSLTSNEEHALWSYTLRVRCSDRYACPEAFEADPAAVGDDSVLGYSDGTQRSRPGTPPRNPSFVHPAGVYDSQWTAPYDQYPGFLEDPHPANGVYTDEERDGDNDGLNNYHETHGYMNVNLWNGLLGKCNVAAWGGDSGAYYGSFSRVRYVEPDYLDPDTDGDGLLDGEDDQDHDDVPNFAELDHPCQSKTLAPEPATGYVNPYNPCAPDRASRTCPRYSELNAG